MDSKFGEGMREEDLLSILSENYEALYYVDFELNKFKPYRMSRDVEERFGEYFVKFPSYEEAISYYIQTVVAPEDQEEMLRVVQWDYLKEALEKSRTFSYDFRVNRNGKQSYFRLKVSNLDQTGELRQAAIGFANVTNEMDRIKQLVETQELFYVLEKDRLTGLYSKEFFFKKVANYLEEHPDENFLLWTSDVQGLKVINEKYGMDKGDEVLRIMSQIGTRYPGFILGGRVEGDKFSALMRDDGPDIKKINQIFAEDNSKVYPVPNVVIKNGIYHIKKNDPLSVQGMYDRSVLALQSIKNRFGYYVAEYDDKLRKDLLVNRQIMESARDALIRKEFQTFFQPKIDIVEGRIGGAEALVRWIHPEFGFMNPGVFIPLFEQNGFISKLDFYIWEDVCQTMLEWQKKGIKLIPISVNVSRRDFEDEHLASKIIDLVDSYGIDHSLFQIEITESSYSDNPDVIQNTIKQLHDDKFAIALDDFGTGYSSMTALSKLDLDVMKLDMSLIQNDVPGTDKNVLEFSMQLAKMMKLKTVAEGVETDAQVKRIQKLGGDYIQGYFYSKPLSKADFEEYLKTCNL